MPVIAAATGITSSISTHADHVHATPLGVRETLFAAGGSVSCGVVVR
jgi:hypothetical protein